MAVEKVGWLVDETVACLVELLAVEMVEKLAVC